MGYWEGAYGELESLDLLADNSLASYLVAEGSVTLHVFGKEAAFLRHVVGYPLSLRVLAQDS